MLSTDNVFYVVFTPDGWHSITRYVDVALEAAAAEGSRRIGFVSNDEAVAMVEADEALMAALREESTLPVLLPDALPGAALVGVPY